MTENNFDALVIGSGAGGCACAHSLVRAGKRVLLLEKGGHLPRDGSTLDVAQVFGEERFKNREVWLDSQCRSFVPGEYHNVGGKTKWYGAALLRFSPQEFEANPAFQCLGWPFGYAELEPWYIRAEKLLGLELFDHEPQLKKLIQRLTAGTSGWRAEALPLGLNPAILDNEREAKHFDGFASAAGYKADAEACLLAPLMNEPNFTLRSHKEVAALLPDAGTPTRIGAVRSADGCIFRAAHFVLAAGAMTSPRLLQKYLDATGLNRTLPPAPLVGAHFKLHLNSALLAFSPLPQRDVLRKTAIFSHEGFPHSSVQCLGWMDGEILATQLPAAVPKFVSDILGARAYGFFVTTEDGSHPDNRIVPGTGQSDPPKLDYTLDRIPASRNEHRAVIRAFKRRLLRAGMVGAAKWMGLSGTAHALGSLVAGRDPETSVVDADGKVHGFANLHVADGSVLPRSSRVNPGLTIFAWGLRLGAHLADGHEAR